MFENLDGSKFNWDAVIPGYTAMAPAKREVYFFRDNLSAAEITAATARGLDMSLYLPLVMKHVLKRRMKTAIRV